MSENWNHRLEDLFRKARTVRPDVTDVERNFETRLMNRLNSQSKDEATLLFWTWRLAPVLTAFLLMLVALNTFIAPQQPPDILTFISNGYTQTQVKKYLVGE